MTARSRAFRALLPLVLLVPVAAQARVGTDLLAEQDPLQKVNRVIWSVDMFADRILIKPLTKGYRAVAPRPARQGLTNFFANVTEPWSLINNLLQGKPKRAARNFKRFLVNSTIGIGGLFDHATKIGIRPANEDLGQTLAVWGFNGGPYLVLPLVGPSTLRDAVGSGAAAYGDPVNFAINQWDIDVWYKRGYRAVQIVSARSDLIESGGDAFLESSLDPYAAARSAYLQRRRAQILDEEDNGGVATPDTPAPAGEAVPTPVGKPDATPDAGESAAPLPGDDMPAPGAGAGAPAPDSAAPLPGDAPAAATPAPADEQPAPESAAPLPGDAPAPASPPHP